VAWRDRDHTRGSLWVSLAVLALPLLTQSGGGVAFQLIDLGFVSRLGDDATTAVVVTNQALRQAFFMLVMGASFGAQGLIARRVGEGRQDAAEHVAGQVVLLGLLASFAIAGIGIALAPALLAGLKVSPQVHVIAVPYARLVFALNFGFVFLFLFNAILQGAGDSTTPLLISLTQSAVAVAAEWCLIFGHFGAPALGVRGVILGLAVGQLVSASLALRVLFSRGGRIHLRRHYLRPDPGAMREIAALSWPPAIQMLGGFVVNVFFIRLLGGFGPEAQAAYAVGMRLSMVGPMLAFPLAGACSVLVAQGLGSGNVPRAWRALRVGLVAHVGVLWSLAALIALLRRPIMSTFASDPAVIELGEQMLLFQAGTFAAWAFFFVFLRSLQGAGDVAVPMLLSLGNSILVTIPLGLLLATDAGLGWGPTGVFAAQLTGSWAITLTTGAWLATGRWTARARALAAAHGA
jgi:putative MATE family efflux protein